MKKRKLTPQQLETMAAIFERTRNGETVTKITKELNIDRRTYYNWKSRPEWIEMEKELQRRLIENAYESVMEGLTRNALATKSPKWVELYLKATGKLKEQESVQVNVSNSIKQDGVSDELLADIDAILNGE
ncbi:hypothetical protein A6283_07715 [Bacillus wiedmannii]|uniref:phBC6A51 family helix-turn-helix protein n=1 Tax=Bacillus wiedmannii TaxID=1890302 RepID=UPI0007DB2FAD|nr:phBC6A51 family helix-turn-helix protein [Bacillus wiedmannii]OAK23945.1 hypothetical protein A6283_07715 [Bacillus wiedmannii]PFF89178.1 hypothetical protein CN338_04805 [Bacillus cereus]PHB73573.1 hypothetical protein COE89_10360 [Bacillus wiedmannii]HDX9670333.1 hypothetical protein [Bacillus cereus]